MECSHSTISKFCTSDGAYYICDICNEVIFEDELKLKMEEKDEVQENNN